MEADTFFGGRWSRRSLIAGAVCALGAPLARSEPEAVPMQGFSLLTIPVTINGQGPYRFVVDTGADRSVLSDTVARELNLGNGTPVMVQGAVRTVAAFTTHIASISVGAVRRENFDLPVLPREQLQADGYLGLDIIDGYRVSLDFRDGLLRLLDPRPAYFLGPEAPKEVQVRVSGENGHLRSVDCLIDGVRCTAFVDTGAEISVGNSELHKQLAAREQGYATRQVVPLTGVTGGILEGAIANLKTVKLRDLVFYDSSIAIADLQIFMLWGLAERPALLIGMNWLRRLNRVAIDYGRKELRFDLAKIRREDPLRCKDAPQGNCRYQLGSPTTIPRPSVAT